ncbi:MAG: ABC transporter permease subunit [Candidatus Promineifilaceae bacterium]|nr:ABC transporter permease subunit [Candidatus Promineifilaceae bacterium]
MEIPASELSRGMRTFPQRPSLWNARTRWLLIFAAALLWSLVQAGIFSGQTLVNSGGWPQFAAFWRAAFQPTLTADFLALTLQATLVTLAYAVGGIFISLLFGAVLGLLASELWWESFWPRRSALRRGPWAAIRGLLAIPRGIHELLWGLLFINIFGLDPLAAVLAIVVPFSAILAKVFAEILDEAPRQAYLALLNSGVSPLKAMLYGLLPEVAADLLSYTFYRFECAIRAAAVLGVIGAGGLGYQILLSMQTLNYNETWTLFYALLLLSGVADAWSAQIRKRLGRSGVVEAALGGANDGRLPAMVPFDRFLRASIWVIMIMTPLSFLYLNPTWSLIWADRSRMLLADIAGQAWPPALTGEGVQELFHLSGLTLAMSILAASLAALGGTLFSFPAARYFGRFNRGQEKLWRRSWRSGLLVAVRALLLLMRAIPAPVWALLLLFVFFPGMLPGALALAIYNLGVLGRLMAEVTENQDERPSQVLRSAGAGAGATFLYGLVPAVTPRYISYSLYRWENAIRETVVVGLVGAGGLGRALSMGLSAFNYRAVLLLLICLVILTFAVDMISAAVRRSLR